MSSIVDKIKELCEKENILVGTLERVLDFSPGLISRWDKNTPSIDKIIAVSKYFNVSTDYLLGLKDEEEKISEVPTLEKMFITKLIADTQKYKLAWQTFSEQHVKVEVLKEVCSLLFDDISSPESYVFIDELYELDYDKSCIYLIGIQNNINKRMSFFVLMQVDASKPQLEDNFVPIAYDEKLIVVLEKDIKKYIRTKNVKPTADSIMTKFIFEEKNDSDVMTIERLLKYYALIEQMHSRLVDSHSEMPVSNKYQQIAGRTNRKNNKINPD